MMDTQYLCAVLTALNQDGTLDVEGNKAICDLLVTNGIPGGLFLGSSGEFFALSDRDKRSLIDLVVAQAGGRMKVFFGTGSCNVDEAIALSRYALAAGADGVVVVSPYYFSLSDADIEAYYDEIANAVDGPIYIYNFPARTGYSIAPRSVARLARRHKNIVGIKDSVADFGHTREIIATVLPDTPEFKVYTGFDDNLYRCALSGGAGCIGAIPNVFPEVCSAWMDAINSGDAEGIEIGQRKIDRLMRLFTIDSSYIAAMKQAMVYRGVPISAACRKPVQELAADQKEELKMLIASI